jgi:NADPH:quinone reductase-like Zn-dependent oxidoreductase
MQDFTQDTSSFDYVFDAVGKSSFGKCKRLLKKNGVFISSELGPYNENPFLALITPIIGGKKVKFPIPLNINQSLEYAAELLEKGGFKPLIDKEYTLEDIRKAYAYVLSGQKIGNVVLRLK